MPRRIEIFTDPIMSSLVLEWHEREEHPVIAIWDFGWDSPQLIWRAMNEVVPSLICSRVRLVSQDGEVLMIVSNQKISTGALDGK